MTFETNHLAPHHFGCAVEDMDAATSFYAKVGLSRCSRSFAISSQSVNVRFIELGQGVFLELVAAAGEVSKIEPFLKVGFYHMCFLTSDMEAVRAQFIKAGATPLPSFPSEAFAGNKCQFFLTPQRTLVEAAEMSPEAFQAFFEENLQV